MWVCGNLCERPAGDSPDFRTCAFSLAANGNRTSCTRNGATDYYGIGSDNR